MTYVLSSLKKLPLLSELALIILLAWMVAGWLLPKEESSLSNMVENIEKTVVVLPDLNAMLAVKLFGQPPQIKAQPIAPTIARPKPVVLRPLTIKLLGTVVAGKSSAAIIAISRGSEQRAFFLGDTIQAGVVLKTVEAESILVDRSGNLERISLEQNGKLNSTPSATTETLPSRTPHTKPPMSKIIGRAHLQKQLQNFPALLSQARAIPHFVNGQVGGFSVSNIVPGSLYQQAGLKNGDIITSINGEKITGAQQAMNIYTKLKNAPSLDLELIRAGGIQNIHYDIR